MARLFFPMSQIRDSQGNADRLFFIRPERDADKPFQFFFEQRSWPRPGSLFPDIKLHYFVAGAAALIFNIGADDGLTVFWRAHPQIRVTEMGIAQAIPERRQGLALEIHIS